MTNNVRSKMTRRAFTGLGTVVALVASSTLLLQIPTCFTPEPPAEPLAVTMTVAPASVTVGSTALATAVATGGTAPYSYAWVQTSGVALSFNPASADKSAESVWALVPGTANFQVTVTDADGATKTATATLTIAAIPTTLAATATAAPSAVVLPATSTLSVAVTGGTPTSFLWIQTAGSAAVLGSPTAATTTATFPAAGTYSFQCSVNAGAAVSNAVTVTVTGSASVASTTFTLNIDNLTGTTGDDIFNAPLVWGGTALADTLTTGDIGAGLAGADTLNATILTALTPALTDIETYNLNFTAGVQFTATNCTGITSLTSLNSTAAGTVAALAALPANFAMTNTGNNNFSVSFSAAATTAMSGSTTDATTLTVTGVGSVGTWPTFDVITRANNIDTLTVASAGAATNYLTLAQSGGAGQLATINISGAARFDSSSVVLPAGSQAGLTVGASGAAGGVNLLLPAKNVAFTGGAGDDRVAFGDGELTTADVLAGGTGTNTIAIADADLVAADAQALAIAAATNFQVLEFTLDTGAITGVDANATALTAYKFTGYDGTARAVTVTKVNNADTFTFGATRSTCTFTPQTDSLSNTLNVTLSKATAGVALTSIAATSNEIINITSSGGAANTVTGATGTTPFTLNILGTQDLTVAPAVRASVIASSFGGKLTVTGTAAADEITGSPQADTITGGAGADVLAGGAGADTFVYTTATNSLNTALDQLTDFASGTDKLDVTTPPTSSGAGTTGVDLNARTVASSGVTAGTLATDIATAVTALDSANKYAQAGDVLVLTVTGDSVGGTNAVYIVIEDGSTAGTYTAAEDTVILLTGTSSTTLVVSDFK